MKIGFSWRLIFEILIIHKPSLGSCEVPLKMWARSVQPFIVFANPPNYSKDLCKNCRRKRMTLLYLNRFKLVQFYFLQQFPTLFIQSYTIPAREKKKWRMLEFPFKVIYSLNCSTVNKIIYFFREGGGQRVLHNTVTLDSKDIGIKNLEFVTKTQFLFFFFQQNTFVEYLHNLIFVIFCIELWHGWVF